MLLIDCTVESLCPNIFTAYLQGLSVGMASLGGADSWLRFLDTEQSLEWQQYGVLSELVAALSSLLGFVLLGMLFSNLGHAMDQRHSHTRLFHARVGNLQAAAQQHQIPKDRLSM